MNLLYHGTMESVETFFLRDEVSNVTGVMMVDDVDGLVTCINEFVSTHEGIFEGRRKSSMTSKVVFYSLPYMCGRGL